MDLTEIMAVRKVFRIIIRQTLLDMNEPRSAETLKIRPMFDCHFKIIYFKLALHFHPIVTPTPTAPDLHPDLKDVINFNVQKCKIATNLGDLISWAPELLRLTFHMRTGNLIEFQMVSIGLAEVVVIPALKAGHGDLALQSFDHFIPLLNVAYASLFYLDEGPLNGTAKHWYRLPDG